MPNEVIANEMRDLLRTQWHRFIDDTEHMRPQLHTYSRRLTANIWDAEDLLQDALLRAFASLATVDDPIDNMQAYIYRIITNLWIDQVRSRGVIEYCEDIAEESSGEITDAERLTAVTEASRELLKRLPPKQLAAILMKDVLDASLEDTAVALQSTVGAVKSLLSRGRKNLTRYSVVTNQLPCPPRALVERFVELFNQEDKPGLLALILDNAIAGNVGTDIEWGYAAHRSKTSWINGSIGGHPEWPAIFRFEAQRAECAIYHDEPIVLHFRTRRGHEALEGVIRLRDEENMINELRSYSFCPDLVRHVATHFQIDVRTGSYRYPTPTRGARFMDL